MKDNLYKFLNSLKWLTLYIGLALFLYVIFDSFYIIDFIYTNASISLLLSWIIISVFNYKESPFKSYFNLDFFTIKKYTFATITPILFFGVVLLMVYALGYDIAKNPDFEFNSYFLNMSILIFILAFFEELLFRGFILEFLSQEYTSTWPIILSSLAFSAAHIFNPEVSLIALANIFLAGIFLAILFLKTQNIIITTLFHFIWNIGQQFFLNSAISGNDIGMNYINISESVNNILSDSYIISKFGIESSVLTTFFLLILTYCVSRMDQSPYLTSLNFRRIYLKKT